MIPMEEQREESENFVGDYINPIEKIGKGSPNIETLGVVDDVEMKINFDDAIIVPETERNGMEVKVVDDVEIVELVDVEKKDETAMSKIESRNGESGGEEETVTSEVIDEKEKCEVEGKDDPERNAQTQKSRQRLVESVMLSVAEKKAKQETVSAKTSGEDDTDNKQANEEKGEAMEIDYVAEEQVGKDVEGGVTMDNAANESAGARRNDSIVVKETEDDVDMANDLTRRIESADSANPKSPSEDGETGEVESLDHNALFDPSSDITNFIDFGGVSVKEGKEATTDMAEEVAPVECKETLKLVNATVGAEGFEYKSSEACDAFGAESLAAVTECPKVVSDAVMGSNENREDKDHVCFDKKIVDEQDTIRVEDGIAYEAPSIDTDMEENQHNSHYADDGTDSDMKTNGMKRKAGVLSEDSVEESKKSVSLASEQVTPENVSSKRSKPSNSSVGGTEAFEFEKTGDTYWTDKVIHNGSEEQTPPTEKGNYQVVPVELKPAQVQRTRRPYRRRQSQISIIPHLVSEKQAEFDGNAPAELIIKFSEMDTIPPEKSLTKMFNRFGQVRELQTEVDKENNRARVVFRKGADAEVAYYSAGRFNIFGTKSSVKYELNSIITEAFEVQPCVVSLGEVQERFVFPVRCSSGSGENNW